MRCHKDNSRTLHPLLLLNAAAAAAAVVYVAGVYLTIVMTMTSISVITAVFVLNLHFRGSDRRPVPSCLRRLINVEPLGFTLRPRHNDVTESLRRDDVSLHDNDWTLTMTAETLARELSRELDTVTVRMTLLLPL